MSLISVEQAINKLLDDYTLVESESLPLNLACGRVVSEDLAARLTQPPFNASAMDGFAVFQSDIGTLPTTLKVNGESSAGHPFEGKIVSGEAVRIFTGAPVPDGADKIVIQENCVIQQGEVKINEINAEAYIRPAGYDFSADHVMIKAGSRLTFRDTALAAAMNYEEISVRRRPLIGVLATGDELRSPGSELMSGEIISSIPSGIAPLIEEAGGEVRYLGIARDNLSSLSENIEKAKGCDVLLTIGGASVGDHDLVQQALLKAGMELDFWRIAMRPGKPLMVGQLGTQKVIGVPGNPVSAHICCLVFLLPLLKAMLGRKNTSMQFRRARSNVALSKNGLRAHYMRALASYDEDGELVATPFDDQDSSLLASFARANALLVRPVEAPAANAGDYVSLYLLDDDRL